MPELPDIVVYVEALERHVLGHPLRKLRLGSPFVLRTVTPGPDELVGRSVARVRRIGKRIVISFDGDLHAILHLMIAGRLRWKKAGAPNVAKVGLAAFDFDHGTLMATEASSKKRASLHIVAGEDRIAMHDPGGLEVLGSTPVAFREAITRERHTVKRALTDPRILSGIGNAFSDEILHRARMSPFKMTTALKDDDATRLHAASVEVLREWIERRRREVGDGFPDTVTAFHQEMAVHGRYRQPCPVCGTAIARIVYADNETNYCPGCQTGGKRLADRALSRLLGSDWE